MDSEDFSIKNSNGMTFEDEVSTITEFMSAALALGVKLVDNSISKHMEMV